MEVLTKITNSEWHEFLAASPEANIFQSPEMAGVYASASGYRPSIVAIESCGELRAIMVSAFISYATRRAPSVTTRTISIGGPLGDSTVFPAVLAAHDARARRASLITQIRNLKAPLDRKPFESAGYRWTDHINFLLDLRKGEAPLLARMSKARRKGIAQADRMGLVLSELRRHDIDAAYGLLRKTYRRVRVPLAPKSLFEAAFDRLTPAGHLLAFGATLAERLKSVRFVLRWGPTLYDWYAGSNLDGSLHADEWLVWQVIRQGILDGCTSFDFGGAGSPGEAYGPREFKRRFGGDVFNPGRFEKIYHPVALKAASAAYSIFRRLA